MKKNKLIKYTSLGVLGIFMASSCSDIMDTEPFSSYSEELVWSSKATADAFVVGTYSSVIGLSDYIGNADGSTYVPYGNFDNLGSAAGFPRETYTVSSDYGVNRFGALRRCNLIIKNATESTGMSANEKGRACGGRSLLAWHDIPFSGAMDGTFYSCNRSLHLPGRHREILPNGLDRQSCGIL
ncbi:MAG: hypothetical protein LUE99_01320 [Bacteroides sp.]|nr:hypothetical protein [Bacteroides sp.]